MITRKISMERFYFLVGILLCFFGLFASETLDISIHDTYFVIASTHIFFVCAILYFLFAGISFLFKRVLTRSLNKSMSIIHFVLTTSAIILTYWTFLKTSSTNQKPKIYRDYSIYGELDSLPPSFDYSTLLLIVIVVVIIDPIYFYYKHSFNAN